MMKQPKDMDAKQEKALDLALMGMSDIEIAKRVEVSRQWVNHWRNQDEDFMQALALRRQALREQHMDRINELVDEAMEAVRDALHSQNENTRLKAAALVLRTSGLQDDMRKEKKGGDGLAEYMRQLSEAIGEAAEELGIVDPTKPEETKQLPDITGK